jgi:hypothetical protein
MKHALYRKALWIADQMGLDTDPEDCYDVLLGNIKSPTEFVAQVNLYLEDYDQQVEKNS